MKFIFDITTHSLKNMANVHQQEITCTQAVAAKDLAAQPKGLQNWLQSGENHRMEIRQQEYRNEAYVLREIIIKLWCIEFATFEELRTWLQKYPTAKVLLFEDNKNYFEIKL